MKIPSFRLLPLLALFAASPCASFAEDHAVLEGTVSLPKTRSAPVVNKRYEIVSRGGVVATNPPLAVVYLEGDFPKPAERPKAQVLQKELTFVPTLLAVRTGTVVEFPNLDDAYHNVFSYSSTKRFDLGRYRSDERPIPAELFDTPGLVTLRCDVHDHMRGLILVVDTPHFALTDPEGRFRLAGLPPGRYVLKAWLNSQKTLEQPVELTKGGTLRVDFP